MTSVALKLSRKKKDYLPDYWGVAALQLKLSVVFTTSDHMKVN